MDLELGGKQALVTASSGGIGEAIATALAREGAEVVVNGRTDSTVDEAIARITTEVPGATLTPLVADLGTLEGTRVATAQLPSVDILVNNLGVYEAVEFLETTDDQWFRLFEINIMSGVRLSRHYLKPMLERNHGRIVFIASEAAVAPAPELPHYSATKSMELSVSRILAEQTAGTAVTVNAVLPGSTRTGGVREFVQDIFPDLSYDEAEARFMADNRPTSLLQRLIDPREVADVVTFVCSARSGAINGSALRADGGIVRTVF
ncbi:MAG: SDR family oxidoreductase [Actinomycetales bacterium]|nr:SDR family oxidoreductase [Actinomycetales bacterium]